MTLWSHLYLFLFSIVLRDWLHIKRSSFLSFLGQFSFVSAFKYWSVWVQQWWAVAIHTREMSSWSTLPVRLWKRTALVVSVVVQVHPLTPKRSKLLYSLNLKHLMITISALQNTSTPLIWGCGVSLCRNTTTLSATRLANWNLCRNTTTSSATKLANWNMQL